MAAIFGVVDFGKRNVDRKLVQKMSEILKHRGPRVGKNYFNDFVGMGLRSYSLIRQFAFNKDRTTCLVIDGEVYNYSLKEIISNLGKKNYFNFIKKLNGAFAIAIWNSQKKQLILIRDRIGIKPLYYFFDKKKLKLIFGSEIKAILQDKTIERKLNKKAMYEYFTFQNVFGTKTFFDGILQILPGFYAVFDKNGLKIKKYWNYKPKDLIKEKNIAISEFRKRFKNSIKKRLYNKTKIGCYLSGGFDSSSITIQASEFKKNLNTFSGYFEVGKKYDERKYSEAVANKVNAKMHKILITPNHFKKYIKDVIWYLEEPKLGMGAFSQFIVSKYAKKYVKFSFSGEGGDELFLGYHIYLSLYLKEKIKTNPLILVNFLRKGLTKDNKIVLYTLLKSFINKNYLFTLFSKRQLSQLFKDSIDYDVFSEIKKMTKNLEKKTDLDKIIYLQLRAYLPSLLVLDDKMSMANSVEILTPMLDNDLVNLSMNTSNDIKLYDLELKYIIKEGMKDKLPQILYEHEKTGFPTPLAEWFRNELKDFVYSILGEDAMIYKYLNKSFVDKIVSDHMAGENYANQIWAFISFEMWLNLFIGEKFYEKK
jgi:asparagine synthase (glutamine-hydrolysing)